MYKENPLFILHGHQASLYSSPIKHKINKFALRFIAHPLHINNIKKGLPQRQASESGAETL